MREANKSRTRIQEADELYTRIMNALKAEGLAGRDGHIPNRVIGFNEENIVLMEKDYVWGGDTKWKKSEEYPISMGETAILEELRKKLKRNEFV